MHIDHVAVVVTDLEAAITAYEALGLVPYKLYEDVVEQYPGEETELHYRACAMMEHRTKDFHIWLMEPKGEGTGLHRFLEKHGPGLHHIGIGEVDLDVAALTASADDAGLRWIRPISDFGREGSRGLVHPRSLQGVLVEVADMPPGSAEGTTD